MKYKIFIDGKEGTTGLKIYERFRMRSDIELLHIEDKKRKSLEDRIRLARQSDVTFLCLPDEAAKEMGAALEGSDTRIIDASTAHRVNPDWVYGFPELSAERRAKIEAAKRVAVPGCYASGFIACVYPLIKAGVLPDEYPLTCHGVSGYSGGGRKMIQQLEGIKPKECESPRQYGLTQNHKHLPEMQKICGLKYKPMFNPIVDDYYSGMVVSVPLLTRYFSRKFKPEEIHQIMEGHYKDQFFVKVAALGGSDVLPDGFLPANELAGTNQMRIFVCGNEDQILVAAQFDNLGKGASGAAMQCMNIMLGMDETTSLI